MKRKEKQNERKREDEGRARPTEGGAALLQVMGKVWYLPGIRLVSLRHSRNSPPPSADASAFTVQGVLLSFLKSWSLSSAPPCSSFPSLSQVPRLREACAPDDSGSLRQLFNFYLKELMQQTFNACQLR